MVNTKSRRLLSWLLAVVMIVSLVPAQTLAAASGTHNPIDTVTVSVSGVTNNSMSNGAVTVTAKGSAGFLGYGASAKTATVTIYNDV